MPPNKPVEGSPAAKAARLKAVRLEREGDLAGAFDAYQQAVALAPSDPELLMALADLASRLEMHEQAVGLWAHLSLSDPDGSATALGHARALVAAGRFAEAMDVLQGALQLHPQEPRLWTTLGLALTYAGRAREALTFFDEAVRLGPSLPGGLYNRGLAHCDLAELAEAQADFAAAAQVARKGPERATIEFSQATVALARGDLAAGWTLYEKRLSPDWPRSVTFQAPGRRLGPSDPLAGRTLLVLAEQGIGDEIMFANLLPDLTGELGPSGRLILAVEPRLVELFRRSFPTAEVAAHATQRVGGRARRQVATPISGRVDLWTPLASLAQRLRPTLQAFPRRPFLQADPTRVEHWKRWLGEGASVGLTWRSGKLTGERQRFYPALEDWAGLLRTPGAQWVNLQYGDCEDELDALGGLAGVEIRRPPGLNIKDDIDDLAALCTALDLVVSVQNATGALAGACGASTIFVAGPGSWTQLGQAYMPWYADAVVCATDTFADWTPALTAAAAELRNKLGPRPV
ncbi:tetratricopeptide repeat protein [Phenylobacterium deserti]|uniref:Flagellar protein FlbA n=1 Tax=Phenylobacterium deserti TaxID=1914756 RepID=A0A328ADD6_9CAUL|nr:tetratricopeptide repeat protein [Phenylobacterium deserti]RAK50738.1 flagellar protein FlbA [Phenylobacterium deserti]